MKPVRNKKVIVSKAAHILDVAGDTVRRYAREGHPELGVLPSEEVPRGDAGTMLLFRVEDLAKFKVKLDQYNRERTAARAAR